MLRKKLSRWRYLYNQGGWQLLFGRFRYKLFGKGRLVEVSQITPVFRNSLKLLERKLQNIELLGDYLEFGVSQGTSLSVMYRELAHSNNFHSRLFGFDSFEGMPASSATEDNGVWNPGDFSQNIDDVRKKLEMDGVDLSRVWLEKGWFNETCTDDFKHLHQLEKASVIMMDCDIYSSTKTALDFCASLIVDQTIIIFDDWHSGDDLAAKNMGEKKAFDEFLANNPTLYAKMIGQYQCYGYNNGVVFQVERIGSVVPSLSSKNNGQKDQNTDSIEANVVS